MADRGKWRSSKRIEGQSACRMSQEKESKDSVMLPLYHHTLPCTCIHPETTREHILIICAWQPEEMARTAAKSKVSCRPGHVDE